MSKQIITNLKSKLDGLSTYGYSITDPETRLNALKEELQFYVLDFIYHHPEYSKWIMYGGSALRICYDHQQGGVPEGRHRQPPLAPCEACVRVGRCRMAQQVDH